MRKITRNCREDSLGPSSMRTKQLSIRNPEVYHITRLLVENLEEIYIYLVTQLQNSTV
jgi:hypothetical protein